MLGEKKSRLPYVTNDSRNPDCINEEKILMDYSRIGNIIDEYDAEIGSLFSILRDVQLEYDHLTPESLNYISKRLNLPLMQVYGVARYYKEFNVWSPRISPRKDIISDTKPEKDYLSKFKQ